MPLQRPYVTAFVAWILMATNGFAMGMQPWMNAPPRLPASGTEPAWYFVNPMPGINPVTSAMWADNMLIAADDAGMVATSADAVAWRRTFSGDISLWRGMATNGSRYVAVGDDGTIWTSAADARQWQRRAEYAEEFFDVIWDGHQFVAVGGYIGDTSGDSVILTSNDGISWETRYSSTDTPLLYAIEWNGSRYVAVGREGTVVTSTDASSWRVGSLGVPDNVRGVAWGADRFVAVTDAGEILSSPDGSAWTSTRTADGIGLFDLVWFGDKFVAGGDEGVFTSPNGVDWEQQSIDVSNGVFRLAAGVDTIAAFSLTGEVATSGDAEAWTTRSSSFTAESPTAIAAGDSVLVVAGDEQSVFRANGASSDWDVFPLALPFVANAISWGNGTFVAVGDDGGIATSIDGGRTWQPHDSPTSVNLTGITWGNGAFVAVGNHQGGIGQAGSSAIIASSDGVDWYVRDGHSLPGDLLKAVVWSGSQFVAVGGDSGFVPAGGDGHNASFTSPNGLDWTRSTIVEGHGPTLHSIASNGRMLVAVGDPSGIPIDPRVIASSPDGIQWTYRAADPDVRSAGYLTAVLWTGSRFFAVGANGTVLKSDEGTAWVAEDPGMQDGAFFAIGALNGHCVAVGYPALFMANDATCAIDDIFADGFDRSLPPANAN